MRLGDRGGRHLELTLRGRLHLGVLEIELEVDPRDDETRGRIEAFAKEGWPLERDRRLVGEDYPTPEWLQVEVLLRLPDRWRERVREAQEACDAIRAEQDAAAWPPEALPEEEREEWWEAMERTHGWFRREREVLESLAGPEGSSPRLAGRDAARPRPRLPEGYRLDASDPDLWVLRREDGSEAAVFSADGAAYEEIERVAKEDRRKRANG